MRALSLVMAVLVGVGQAGCGVLLQTALGWSEEKRERSSQAHVLRVETTPPGARVTRLEPDGPVDLGVAPVDDRMTVTRERVWTEPKTLGLFLGGGLTTAGAIGLIAVGANRDDGSLEGSTSAFGLIFLGTLILLGGLTELATGALYGAFGGGTQGNRVLPESYRYSGQIGDEPPVTASAVVPNRTQLVLSLGLPEVSPTPKPEPVPPPPSPVARSMEGSIVAVMEVEDVNAGSMTIAIDPDLIRNLGDQLRIFIGQRGVRTIDRGSQESVLRDRIQGLKTDSYRSCYDDTCQIELGKALAATHILRSRITRFGSRCVLNAELIDLRSEVTVRASSSRGGCEAEGFLAMGDALSQSLFP